MTIKKFAERTGLIPSTLRFYDQKGLLKPAGRLENGYRVYLEEQVHQAQIIHSLRLAVISIQDIHSYLNADEEKRQHLLSGWRLEVEEKLASLQVAKQYLNGINTKEQHMQLVKWDEQPIFIWFRHTVKRQTNPFQAAMLYDMGKIKKLGLGVRPGVFLRTLDSTGDSMTGEIGFILTKEPSHAPSGEDMYFEKLKPMVYATLECCVNDPFICFQFMRQVHKFGFQSNGVKLERFESPTAQTFRYMIPVLAAER
ncbi:helix-turn-helix domain-containing protein [Bacillus sp. FJAT-27245]|uniref:helix-turn-helix domain-containing protein n=1 Tax=Bacillus sp. FJAT-27245 TaxID=1684144 RepID=UPI0006A79042|nr:MerR family transcriptional regulator [Bacillus sp. FJAT-27245]